MSNVLRDALDYHRRGLTVIPIRPGTKKAALPSWKPYQHDRPDEETVRRWFSRGDPAIAIVLGTASGNLVCRDFDCMGAYDAWRTENPDLAGRLPTVETSRGRHVYARVEEPCRTVKYDDGELRGNGTYCLAPQSVHPTGHRYRWLIPIRDEVPVVSLGGSGLNATQQAQQTQQTQADPTQYAVSAVLHAIAATLPAGLGRRNRAIFQFARGLKAIPELANASAVELQEHVREWHRQALPKIRTKEFDETWIDFLVAWDSVRFAAGQEPIHALYQQALERDVPRGALQFDDERIRRLVGLCRELQEAAGDRSFFLDVRTAGKLLDVEHTKAWRWLKALQASGTLELVARGSRGSRKANEYRYRDK